MTIARPRARRNRSSRGTSPDRPAGRPRRAPSRRWCCGRGGIAVTGCWSGDTARRLEVGCGLSRRTCGQGREDQRMLRDRRGHGLASGDPGADEVEHVRRVDPRAGQTLTGASIPARHVGDPERLIGAAVARHHLSGGQIDRLGAAPQLDRVGAVPDPGDGVGPIPELPRQQPRTRLPRGPVWSPLIFGLDIPRRGVDESA